MNGKGNANQGGPVAVFALGAAMLLWSSSFVAMKEALKGFEPLTMIALRMCVGAACFLLMLPWLRNGLRYVKGDWKWLVGMALCEPCLYFICESYALRYTSASQAGMVVAVLPLLAAVCAWVLFKERLTVRAWAGFFVAIGGVVWLSSEAVSTENAPDPLLGNALEMLAMLCATAYTMCVRRLCLNYSPLFITAVQSWVGVIFFSPALFFVGLPETIPLKPALAVFYLGACITLGAYGCYNFGISRLGAARAAAYTNLIPVLTLFMGMTLQGDTLTVPQYQACAVILAGVFLSQGKAGKAQVKS